MEEFEPWQPHAESPFTEVNGRLRTNSQILQMHSLRSVHGTLQKISFEMEKTSSSLVEFEESGPLAITPARPEDVPSRPHFLSGIGANRELPVTAMDRPSIQRNSMTPEPTWSSAVPSTQEGGGSSWEQFVLKKSLQVDAGKDVAKFPGPLGTSNVPPSQVVQFSNGVDGMLQPVRSVPLDPSSNSMTCATSVFVSRQFETISRKDIVTEELDSRHAMVLLFSQATHTLLMRERFNENRALRERIASLEEREIENQIAASEGLREIEAHAREQLHQVQLDAARQVQAEVAKMLSIVEESNMKGGVKWLVMHEERRRHELDIESDRALSRMMGDHISQLQRMLLSFQLYHARAQNIAAKDAFVPVDDADDSFETESVLMSNAEEPSPAPGGETRYDPYHSTSIAGGSRQGLHPKATPSNGNSSLAAPLAAVPDSKTYVQDLITRRVKDETEARNAAKSDSSRAAVSRIKPNHLTASEMRAEQEADIKREREARAERLRQTKAAAIAARSAPSAGGPSAVNSPASEPSSSPASRPTSKNQPTGKMGAHQRKKAMQIVEDAEKDQTGSSLLAGVPAFENEDDAEARRKADTARRQLTQLGQFEPVWGWMLKSTGVLMSWQRRFFVMTKSGKIKYTAQDPAKEESVKWVHLLNAEDITRVESDTFADSTVRPPADQYHNNCFYVDAVRSHRHPGEGSAPKTERFKFCCSNKSELNKWMWSLRNATDVVYTLEEGGLVQRSPLREHFRKMYSILSPLLCSSMQAARLGQGAADAELPTYRKRIQMEDDIAALEAQQREALQKEKQRQEEEQKYYMLSPRNARSPSPPKPSLL